MWCVTTSLGSWTACVDGQVFLTGNSHNWYRNGLDFVPKDNWPAVLHRGERVLTAEENARYGQLPEVHVYIGERELTDLVDVRVDYTQRQMLARSRAGVGRRA